MIVGVAVESHPDECRVALVPSLLAPLIQAGLQVLVEPAAGVKAGFADAAYEERGGRLAKDRGQLFRSADVILQVHGLDARSAAGHIDIELTHPGQVLVGLLNPWGAPEAALHLAEKGVTTFALELLPRISRAQPMDALTAMATVTGYKAVLVASGRLHKMFPMMITAAGTITPARVFVVGAGVAGLHAIATAHRLGAVVGAYDIRPAVKEQVESLGAKFLELDLEVESAEGSGGYARPMGEDFYRRQKEMLTRAVATSDVVIATAAVPGKKAPMLIGEEAVRQMRPGSVIVDLAAETGGNCELTRVGETLQAHGVTIMGPTNLASTVPCHASRMYAGNVTAFLLNLVQEGSLHLNMDDQIVRDTLVTHGGEVVNERVRRLLGRTGAPSSVKNERSSS